MQTLRHFASRLPFAALALPLMMLATSCSRFDANGSLSTWGYVLLALDLFAMFDVFRQPWTIGKKLLWAAVIFFFPFIGLIIYFMFAGRGKSNTGVV
ncbi:PLD nuclease N-terminal domain-containing protein [Hymenobacter sp. BT770]|uniref:PLD nuclease N-terminal domain-containing protein n=1 Tax=Hymenobacter sp. BT770 TaxID=2886942 RepID=UPI001D109092|nr:PLD nuclease N-terminal domain-containing protein [Hymenobacter sp. BT770]MCC3153436.1 PLD nuclease N-terminal domain-containing protein [Hymenobacter sp. BT770]MDO3415482.1 PLD nuclease N-terminal domain-containing protein [Hymenobacter sp. BT770]